MHQVWNLCAPAALQEYDIQPLYLPLAVALMLFLFHTCVIFMCERHVQSYPFQTGLQKTTSSYLQKALCRKERGGHLNVTLFPPGLPSSCRVSPLGQ